MNIVSKQKNGISYKRPRVLLFVFSAVILTVGTVNAQSSSEQFRLEARFSLMGEITENHLEAKINVIALPDETAFRSFGIFWKDPSEAEGEVFYSGGTLFLDGYRLDYADGQILQSHVKLEHRDKTRSPLYGALLGSSGRLYSDNVSEPVLTNETEIAFLLQISEENPAPQQATILFSFIDMQGETFIGTGLALIDDLEMLRASGVASEVSLQEGPSWNTRYVSFELSLANSQNISVPLAIIMPEVAFRPVTE